jgi:hypothetical protein
MLPKCNLNLVSTCTVQSMSKSEYKKSIFIYTSNFWQLFLFGNIVTSCYPTKELLIIQLYELSVLMWDVCKIAQVYAEYDLIPFIHMTDEIINMQVHIKHVLELRPGIHYVGWDGV